MSKRRNVNTFFWARKAIAITFWPIKWEISFASDNNNDNIVTSSVTSNKTDTSTPETELDENFLVD